ncbi:hypothetical protein DBV15_05987 [Temnothorax longispinosus]|uniref:Uncharacterized protein n=1 Tax=Temnothorax longispinosus TaxID=300112 RepID=A0A4S2KHT8_9HYME|nr:hypothetical protein DBV15_05987 [Temnothorax longispinosus]
MRFPSLRVVNNGDGDDNEAIYRHALAHVLASTFVPGDLNLSRVCDLHAYAAHSRGARERIARTALLLILPRAKSVSRRIDGFIWLCTPKELVRRSTIPFWRKHSRTNASRLFREASCVGDVCLRQPRCCGTESERRSQKRNLFRQAFARALLVLVCEEGQAGAKGGVCEMWWVPKAQRQPRGYGARVGGGGGGGGRRKDAAREKRERERGGGEESRNDPGVAVVLSTGPLVGIKPGVGAVAVPASSSAGPSSTSTSITTTAIAAAAAATTITTTSGKSSRHQHRHLRGGRTAAGPRRVSSARDRQSIAHTKGAGRSGGWFVGTDLVSRLILLVSSAVSRNSYADCSRRIVVASVALRFNSWREGAQTESMPEA